jgi:hypothetical protein
MQEEAIVASVEIMSQHFPRGLRKIVKNLSKKPVFWQKLESEAC